MKRILFFLCFLFLCAIDVNSQKQNIVLSDFTKEIVDLMIDEYSSIKNEDDNYIILNIAEFENDFALGIDMNVDNGALPEYREWDSFWGEIKYKDRKILIFGSPNSPFVSMDGTPKDFFSIYIDGHFVLDDDYWCEYDPLFWSILVNKQLELNVEKKHKLNEYEDISDIVNIAKKYFTVPDFVENIIKERVYYNKNGDGFYLYFDTPNDRYLKYGRINSDYEYDINVLKDEQVIDTISVFTLVNLQFDTTNVCSGDKINYEILSFGVMFTKPKDIGKELLVYLMKKIKNELENYELYVVSNVNKPMFQYNFEEFPLRFIFVPLEEN